MKMQTFLFSSKRTVYDQRRLSKFNMVDKTFLIFLLSFSFFKFGNSSSASEILKNLKFEVDDELCKSQVKSYLSSLAKDEAWAVDSRIILKSVKFHYA